MKLKKVAANVCPVCGSSDLEYMDSGLDLTEGRSYLYEIECNSCGAEWTEIYNLEFDGIEINGKYVSSGKEDLEI